MYKILIVEDEDLIRKGLQYTMPWQELGCVVICDAKNGKEGLEKIDEFRPDIVLSDIKMPVMDGLEMLKQSISEYKFKAIILSGYNEFNYAQQAISLGVTEYLLKPIDFDLLYSAVSKIIKELQTGEYIQQKINATNINDEILNIKSNNKYVEYMLEYIGKNYAQRISITDISMEQNISCAYLNSKFKAETGYTFNDYLNRYRIQRAVELIRENKYKIYEIAEILGFIDYKYFVKVFKKYTGHTPSQIGEL